MSSYLKITYLDKLFTECYGYNRFLFVLNKHSNYGLNINIRSRIHTDPHTPNLSGTPNLSNNAHVDDY